ncbi:MAG TPA: hypothetical protein VGB76_12300 [Pyrinomonadaceae bacterium]|jgi:hypothetical protein
MNDLPRHTLSRIIAEHGRGICDAPKRVEALLRDLCGAHRREINIISGALEERVAADLIAVGNSVPRDVLLARLAARLRDNLAYTPEAARWGVETWAVALGILSEAELQERARRESSEAERSNAQPPVEKPKLPTANPPSVNQSTPPMQRGTTYAPSPQQPAQTPKTNPSPQRNPSPQTNRPQPSIARQPAPAPRRTPTVHPHVIVHGSPPQQVSPSLPDQQKPRRGSRLRGCLVLFVLIILFIVGAVLVAPAVIMLLKEEQAQPSINEPRIP